MDCRRLISFPKIRKQLVASGLEMLKAENALANVDAVSGGEASGIALAAWIAEALDIPMLYVRKKPRGRTQVEGVFTPGSKVLLIDDLIAAGHSKVTFSNALKDAGLLVQDLFVVFSYGTFSAELALSAHGIRVHAMADWSDVRDVARERGAFDGKSLDELDAFIKNPSGWSLAHGGIGAPPASS
ncbi:MAG: orotate phosphoribosyltransferase [Betaproteobacteria bacterium HGW-Betaproteobacteria-18]|nr:MAG: orotate phosphoribosyltransferase [Betaproteobacteria bacterium HGW-Betaproteobacteria-18]